MKKLSTILIAGMIAVGMTGCAGMQPLNAAQTAAIGGLGGALIAKATGAKESTIWKAAAVGAAAGYYVGFKNEEARALQAQLQRQTSINFDLQQQNEQMYLQSMQISSASVIQAPKKIITKKMFGEFKKTCDIALANNGEATVVIPPNRQWMADAMPNTCKVVMNDKNTDNIVVVLKKRA